MPTTVGVSVKILSSPVEQNQLGASVTAGLLSEASDFLITEAGVYLVQE